MNDLIQTLARELDAIPEYVENVVRLIDEGATIPFIARYRKELHGSMDDQLLRRLADRLQYLRGLAARKEEVHHAKEEGIIFDLLTNPISIEGDEKGHVQSMTCIRMELGEPDASGRRRPIEVPGSEFDVDVDCVIMALGTSPNPLIKSTTKGLEINKKGGIVVNEDGLTSRENVYAGGDAVTGAATVILAMGAGKTAAKAIDEALSKK